MEDLGVELYPHNLNTKELVRIIRESKDQKSRCHENETSYHKLCFDTSDVSIPIPQCSNAFTHAIIELLADKPELFDDELRDEIAQYYSRTGAKVHGLISIEYLTLLNKTRKPTVTWIKYENLISHLIKKQVYEPKTIANEVLTIAKDDIPNEIGTKFASVLESCVKHCREANKTIQNEEEEEKWCEIIDWMSWFIGSIEEL